MSKNKKRVYCYSCKKEYVITSLVDNKKLKKKHSCNLCGNKFIFVENDRGHSISFKFAEQDIIY
jgi:transcription elongation factor Elf1